MSLLRTGTSWWIHFEVRKEENRKKLLGDRKKRDGPDDEIQALLHKQRPPQFFHFGATLTLFLARVGEGKQIVERLSFCLARSFRGARELMSPNYMEQPEVNQNKVLKNARRKLLNAANSIEAMRLSELQLPAKSEWNVLTSFSLDLWLGKHFSVVKSLLQTNPWHITAWPCAVCGRSKRQRKIWQKFEKWLDSQTLGTTEYDLAQSRACLVAFVHHNLWIKWAAKIFTSSDLKGILSTLCNPLIRRVLLCQLCHVRICWAWSSAHEK